MEISQPPRSLPAPEAYPEPGLYYAPRPFAEVSTVPLNHYFWVLRRCKWRILGFVLAVGTAVLLYSLQLTPMYESTATLEIDNQAQLFEIGNSGLQFDNRNFDTVVATELEMMSSPIIAEQVIRELHLERNPDFNQALRAAGRSAADASFTPPAAEPQVPAALPGLRLDRRQDTYLIEVRYRSPNPELAAAIANATAQAVIQQGFKTRYQTAAELSKWLNKQLEDLKAKLERAQANLRAYEKEHNVVNPEDRTNILNLQLQRLQEELTRAQAERLRKESAFRAVEKGDLETLAISEQGEPLLKLAERVENLESQLAEAGAQYGPNHPNYKRLENQVNRTRGLVESYRQKVLGRVRADYEQAASREKALSEAVTAQKEEVDRLGARAAEYSILKRDVDSQTKLYDELLKKINEASINTSIKATNLRLASLATPSGSPVSPNIQHNVLLALLMATGLAVGAALTFDYLDRTLRSGEQVEQWLQLPVLANVPRIVGKKAPSVLLETGAQLDGSTQLVKSGMPFTEALSMLRTSLLLTAPVQDLRMVLVASAVPSEGKSTVASGLALALAQQLQNGNRVLLIDSDLRRPTIHTIFGLPNRLGLSTVLEGQSTLAESILPSGNSPNLMVLPAGPVPRFSGELLTMHMARLLENIRQEYRYTVIDSAPMLVCADATIVSTMADGVVLVTRAGGTSRDAVTAVLRQLRRVRASVLGVVLNQVSGSDTPGYGGYYSGYYSYHHSNDPEQD